MELFAKIISHVRIRLCLRCLTRFWMYMCCVRDNYLSVNFSIQPLFVTFLFAVMQSFFFFNFFDFAWNLYTCTTIGKKIVLERLVIFSNLFLHNWRTKIIGIRPYVSTWCSNIKKIKAHKVCILWGLLILSSIP